HRIDAGERFTLAFVAGTGGILVIDLTQIDAPRAVGQIRMPGIQRELALDASGTILVAGGDSTPVSSGPQALFVIDASRPFAQAAADATGRDTRIVFEAGYPSGIDGMSVDSQRGMVYVGWPAALDIWCFTSVCKANFNRAPVANAGPDQIIDIKT